MVTLSIPEDLYREVRDHLLQNEVEQVAFLFCGVRGKGEDTVLDAFDWHPVHPNGFVEQHEYYVELTDDEKARVIKEAWDHQAALVEVHSHPKSRMAEFSYSDLDGLQEFVPHVRWRLKGRPYVALIMVPREIDALAWISKDGSIEPVDEIRIGTAGIKPSGRTYERWSRDHDG